MVAIDYGFEIIIKRNTVFWLKLVARDRLVGLAVPADNSGFLFMNEQNHSSLAMLFSIQVRVIKMNFTVILRPTVVTVLCRDQTICSRDVVML